MNKSLLTSLFLFSINVCFSQINVTASSGTSAGTYVNLKSAFDAINAGVHQGGVVITVTSNTTETGQAILNASGGTSNYSSVVIKPGLGVVSTISGAVANGALVRILGSNVTIDGSNSGGTSRDLTFENTSVTSPNVVSVVGSSSVSPVHHVVLKNTNFINGAKTSYGVVFHDDTTNPSTGGYFNDITITNNTVKRALIGFYLYGSTVVGVGSNTIVSDNELDTSGVDALVTVGIYVSGWDGININNNTIGNFDTSSAYVKRGIWIADGCGDVTVSQNTIHDIHYPGSGSHYIAGIGVTNSRGTVKLSGNTVSNLSSSGSGAKFAGILVEGHGPDHTIVENNRVSGIKTTNIYGAAANGIYFNEIRYNTTSLIANNLVYGVSSYGATANGILIATSTGFKVYHNTVNMDVSQAGPSISSAFRVMSSVTTTGAIDLRNNLFSNKQTHSGERYALYSDAPKTVFSTINYNNYYSNGTNLGYIGGPRVTLADIQTGFDGNINSLNVAPEFISATDLHLSNNNVGLDNKGIFLADVPLDYDNVTRHLSTPDLGAYEFSKAAMAVEEVGEVKVLVYPNPTTNTVKIVHPEAINAVEIFNTAGRKISSFDKLNRKTIEINVSAYPSGIYLLKMYTAEKQYTVKLIKR